MKLALQNIFLLLLLSHAFTYNNPKLDQKITQSPNQEVNQELSNTCPELSNIITYKLNPGRLGDHLLAYIKAKIVSRLSGLPISCRAFKWSNHFALSKYEKSFSLKSYTKVNLNFYTKKNLNKITRKCQMAELSKPIAYVCDLKTKIKPFKGFNDIYKFVRSNQLFKNELLRMVAPIEPIEQLDIPTDMVSVAVHIRTGGTFEKTSLQQHNTNYKKVSVVEMEYPTRFPPEEYYIEQLKKIAEIIKKPLFVHIFTDDTKPLAIIARFKKQLPPSDYAITFSCRTTENDHNLNVLYDLFNMTRFNCLIRPASSFSKIAQLLGDHRIIIYPAKASWIVNQVVVTKVSMINHYNDSPSIK